MMKLTSYKSSKNYLQRCVFSDDFQDGVIMNVPSATVGAFKAGDFIWFINGTMVASSPTSDITVTFTEHSNTPFEYVEATLEGEFTDLRTQEQKTLTGSFRLLQL